MYCASAPVLSTPLIRTNKGCRGWMVAGESVPFSLCVWYHWFMKDYEQMLKALANRRRLTILRYLRREREARVGAIAAAIKLSFKATSRHLQQLSAADIVERDQRGLEMWYRIGKNLSPPVKTILDYIPNSPE